MEKYGLSRCLAENKKHFNNSLRLPDFLLHLLDCLVSVLPVIGGLSIDMLSFPESWNKATIIVNDEERTRFASIYVDGGPNKIYNKFYLDTHYQQTKLFKNFFSYFLSLMGT